MPEFLKHKKFQVAIITALAIFFGQLAAPLADTGSLVHALALLDWMQIAAPLLTAIGAQGIADFGKERAKIENGHKVE
jgi:hypothetical protein